MTRILAPSGGGKYVKPKAVPRSSPKPHYVPIKAPPPAPATRPTSTQAGNNPRGVAIVTKAPPSKTITTGANPRGVQIKAPKYYVVKPPKPPKVESHSSGGGGILGAIEGAPIIGSIAGTVTHIPHIVEHAVTSSPIIHNTLKDVVNLVPSSIEGVGTIAQAVGHDITGVAEGALHVGPGAVTQPAKQHSAVEALAKAAVKGSVPYALLVEHNPGKALAMFKANPLNVALQFTGTAGLVGRAAGILSRTGALGSTLEHAASLEREDRVLVPGVKGETRHYHPNVIVSAGQHLLDKHEDHRPQYLNTRKLNRRVDDIHGVTRAIASKHEQDVLNAQADAIHGDRSRLLKTPAGRKAASNVASYVVQGAASGEHLVAELHDLRGKIHDALHDPERKVSGTARKAAEAHIKNIDEFLADPDVAAIHEIASKYADRQRGTIDPEMVNRGLLSKDQAEKAHLVPYVAAGHMGEDVRVLTKPEKTVRAVFAKQAADEADKATQVVKDAKLVGGKLTEREHIAIRSASLKAERALNQAEKSANRRTGQLEGRYGRKLEPSERSNRYLAKVSAAKQNLQDARAASRSDRADRTEATAKYLEAAKDNMKDARDQAKDLKVYGKEKLKPGTVVRDVQVGVRNGKLVYAVRRVPATEIEQHMVEHGKDPNSIAYVNLGAPREPGEVPTHASTNLTSRGDSAIRSRTAREITTGNWKPGHTALADSQVGSMRRIDRAKGFDHLVQQTAIHENGEVVSGTKDTIAGLKEEYEKQHPGVKVRAVPLHSENDVAAQGAKQAQAFVDDHGEPLSPTDKGVSKKQRFGLVPETALKRYQAHVEADKPSYFGSAGVVTRAFRNTVLPFSPKWLVGNVVEAALRSALVGAGPGDAQLFRTVIQTMRDAEDHDSADALEAYANGQHYSMAQRQNEKMTGAGALNKPPPHALEVARNLPALKQALDVYHGLVQKIYGFNHRVEQRFSHAAMGAHMRTQLTEFGANWMQAASRQDEWMQKLAQGYADPELARDAGRFVQQTLGKYDRFSPGMKKYVNNIAPFAPWYWNALRFVYATMPGLHPLAQSVLLSAAQTEQATYLQQMKDVGGLGANFGGVSMGSLNSSLHEAPGSPFAALSGAGPGGYLNLGRYTPWSAPADGPVNFLSSQILPQGQGIFLAAVAKEDAFGNPLKDKNGDVTSDSEAAIAGLSQGILSIAGPLDFIHRMVSDHGATEYSGSSIFRTELKPDSQHGPDSILGGVNRVWNPLYPTYLNPQAATPSAPSSGVVGRAGKAVVGRSGAAVVGRSGTTVIGR